MHPRDQNIAILILLANGHMKRISNKQIGDYLSKLGELVSKNTSYKEKLTSVANKLKLTFKSIERNNREKAAVSEEKCQKIQTTQIGKKLEHDEIYI